STGDHFALALVLFHRLLNRFPIEAFVADEFGVLGCDDGMLEVPRNSLVAQPLMLERCVAVLLAQLFRAGLHERRGARIVRVPPQHMRVEPGLHARERNNEKANAIAQGLPRDARDAHHSSAGLILLPAARSPAITRAVSGRTPRQREKESAACSTSMPTPSEVVAPHARAITR